MGCPVADCDNKPVMDCDNKPVMACDTCIFNWEALYDGTRWSIFLVSQACGCCQASDWVVDPANGCRYTCTTCTTQACSDDGSACTPPSSVDPGWPADPAFTPTGCKCSDCDTPLPDTASISGTGGYDGLLVHYPQGAAEHGHPYPFETDPPPCFWWIPVAPYAPSAWLAWCGAGTPWPDLPAGWYAWTSGNAFLPGPTTPCSFYGTYTNGTDTYVIAL